MPQMASSRFFREGLFRESGIGHVRASANDPWKRIALATAGLALSILGSRCSADEVEAARNPMKRRAR